MFLADPGHRNNSGWYNMDELAGAPIHMWYNISE